MIEEIQGFYDKVFDDLKSYLATKTTYKPYVFKQEPESKLFPLVVFKEPNRNSTYTTLNYKDERYIFNGQINIFAIKDGKASGRTICDDISKQIENFFHEVYRMNVNINPGMINIDEDVSRTIIYISCVVDTKFGDKLVIYPE